MERLSEWLWDVGDMRVVDANRLSERLGVDGISTLQSLCNRVRSDPQYLAAIGVDRLDIEGILGALSHEISNNTVSDKDIEHIGYHVQETKKDNKMVHSQPISEQTLLGNLTSSIQNKEYSPMPALFHALVDLIDFIKGSRRNAEQLADRGCCDLLGHVMMTIRSISTRSVMQSSMFHQWAVVHVASKTFEAISRICRYGQLPDTTISPNVDKFYRISFSSHSVSNSDFINDFTHVLDYCLSTSNRIIDQEGKHINHDSRSAVAGELVGTEQKDASVKPCVGFYREVMIAEAACCRWAYILIYDMCALNNEMKRLFSNNQIDEHARKVSGNRPSSSFIIDMIITSLQRFSVVIEEASKSPMTRKKRDVGPRAFVLSAIIACDAASRAIVNLSSGNAANTGMAGRGGGCVCLVQILKCLMSLRVNLRALMSSSVILTNQLGATIEEIEQASRSLVQSICLAIGNLSALDENRSRFLQLALPELLVNSGVDEVACIDVCEAVCSSIANIVSASSLLSATFSGSLSWDGRCRLVRASCCEYLLNVFWIHYRETRVITAACLAIGNICITPTDGSGEVLSQENARDRICSISDSHRIILDGLRACFSEFSSGHSSCNCECICVALANLCYKHQSNRNMMAEKGACSLIASILCKHCSCLDKLGRVELIEFLKSDEAGRSSSIVGQAALAIGNLSSSDEIRLKFSELDGVCESLVQMLRNYNLSYVSRSADSKPIGGAGRACFAMARLMEFNAVMRKFEQLKAIQILDTIIYSELIPDHVIREARRARDFLPYNRKI